jgi:hypothetical protein
LRTETDCCNIPSSIQQHYNTLDFFFCFVQPSFCKMILLYTTTTRRRIRRRTSLLWRMWPAPHYHLNSHAPATPPLGSSGVLQKCQHGSNVGQQTNMTQKHEPQHHGVFFS